jgi:hypothetical protein
MEIVLVMWSAWVATIVLTAVVVIFASRMGRYEESQLFLADSSSHAKSEQDAIAARLSRIQPLKLSTLALAGVMTLLVVAYYVQDSFHQLSK